MSSHDEYSSDDEDLTAGNSEVLLGYVDISLDEEAPSIEDSFIGGQPVWLHEHSVPKPLLLQCGHCHKEMALLLQAYCPFEGGLYDRVIYLFACKDTRQCSGQKGSIRAIRGVCKDPKRMKEIQEVQDKELEKLYEEKMRLEKKRQYEIEVTKDLFSATKSTGNPFSNPFGANPFDSANPFGAGEKNQGEKEKDKDKEKKKAQKDTGKEDELPVHKHKEGSKAQSSTSYASAAQGSIVPEGEKQEREEKVVLPSFPGYFIYTEQEKFKKVAEEDQLEKYKHLIEASGEPSKERSMSQSSGTLNPENNKIAAMLNDKYFENFTNVVGHNPAQVLRYHLGGKPLLYSGKDNVARTVLTNTLPDPAYNPSSLRRFELQLMPKAIIDLESTGSGLAADILAGMAWGTIIVATDIEDYVPRLDANHVAYVEEYCGVQWEENIT